MSTQRRSLGSFWFVLLVCILCSAVTYAQAIPAIPSLSNSQMAEISAGGIIVDVGATADDVPMGDAIGIINATPEEVIRVIEDFDNYEDIMDDMELAEILRTPEQVREVILDMDDGDEILAGLDVDALHAPYVGDSPNDAPLFEAFAHSIGVANVARFLGDLESPPTYITSRPCGAGFAQVVRRVLQAREAGQR